jgi:anti-sigma factor RsiW
MNTDFLSHIPEDTLETYALGRVPVAHRALLDEHLLTCPDCQICLAEMDEYIKVMQAAIAEVSCVVITS